MNPSPFPSLPAATPPHCGRVILITGAARGIGAAVALSVASPDAALVLHARSESPELQAVAQQCRAGRTVHAGAGRPGRSAHAAQLRDTALTHYGRLDALVANAGFADRKRIGELDDADWSRSLDALLGGFFRLITACREPLEASGQGRVVAVSSFVAHVFRLGESGFPASAAAKAGIEALVKSLAVQVAAAGVTVNAVAPGYVQKVTRPSRPSTRPRGRRRWRVSRCSAWDSRKRSPT
jgi:NAD(P)-dependent dehydrogenase (short-subunit alcohol dehydrogenase family)